MSGPTPQSACWQRSESLAENRRGGLTAGAPGLASSSINGLLFVVHDNVIERLAVRGLPGYGSGHRLAIGRGRRPRGRRWLAIYFDQRFICSAINALEGHGRIRKLGTFDQIILAVESSDGFGVERLALASHAVERGLHAIARRFKLDRRSRSRLWARAERRLFQIHFPGADPRIRRLSAESNSPHYRRHSYDDEHSLAENETTLAPSL
jgi:hypothetical protein